MIQVIYIRGLAFTYLNIKNLELLYYQLFGSALAASKMDKIPTKGGAHDWRHDLVATLAKSQRPDGSWVNTNRQFMENDPNLCTAFALLALSNCDDQPSGK